MVAAAGGFVREDGPLAKLFPRAGIFLEATMKYLISLLVGASLMLGLGACNTVEGVGKDVKAGGQKVENEAQEHKRY